MRLFIGIDIDEPVQARVGELLDRESAKLDARWVRAESLHLTLIFFGEIADAMLPKIVGACTLVATRHSAFELSLDGSGTFGPPERPKVLWLGVTGALDPLNALLADLEKSLDVVSEYPEFKPHLTLARAQMPRGDPALREVARRLERKSFGGWRVGHFTVYESAGARYRPLAKLTLR